MHFFCETVRALYLCTWYISVVFAQWRCTLRIRHCCEMVKLTLSARRKTLIQNKVHNDHGNLYLRTAMGSTRKPGWRKVWETGTAWNDTQKKVLYNSSATVVTVHLSSLILYNRRQLGRFARELMDHNIRISLEAPLTKRHSRQRDFVAPKFSCSRSEAKQLLVPFISGTDS